MKENKLPETQAIETAELVEAQKCMVNCPKCSTMLYVKMGNFAHLCPVCSNVFRIRTGEKLVRDITSQTMVEAFINVDKDYKGEVRTKSVVNELKK